MDLFHEVYFPNKISALQLFSSQINFYFLGSEKTLSVNSLELKPNFIILDGGLSMYAISEYIKAVVSFFLL